MLGLLWAVVGGSGFILGDGGYFWKVEGGDGLILEGGG